MFFPCSVYAMLKLKKHEREGSDSTAFLKSNLVYIRNFRFETLLQGEEDYYLQTLENIVEFIQTLHDTYKENLKLDQGEDLPTELEEWAKWDDDEPKPESAAS